MRIALVVTVVLAAAGGFVAYSATLQAEASVDSPPSGLTAYGRVVWNVDALLHDTFGARQVWEDYTGNGQIPNFSTTFLDRARSVPWRYTFATARHSDYRALRPKHPPGAGVYATGSNLPVKIRGAYISCGDGRWLYSRSGQAMFGGDIWCARQG